MSVAWTGRPAREDVLVGRGRGPGWGSGSGLAGGGAARAVAVALVLLVGVWAAYDKYMPFWTPGVSVAGVLVFVAGFTLVPVAIAGGVALFLRRRGRAAWFRYLVLFGQAGWAAFVAGLAFALSDLATGEPAGWGLAALAFAVGLAMLGLAWWAEDALARRR